MLEANVNGFEAGLVAIDIEFRRRFDLLTTVKASQNLKNLANFLPLRESVQVVQPLPDIIKYKYKYKYKEMR